MTDQHHTITVTWDDDGWQTIRLNCHAPLQSDCHAKFDCHCEYWVDPAIKDGTPSHSDPWADDPTRHVGTLDQNHCNLIDWFGATEEHTRGSITVPVRAEWDDEWYLFHVGDEVTS